MSHAAIHVALGLIAGALLTLPRLARAWVRKRPLARACGRWLVLSYALGVYALIPSILGRLGVPPAVCQSEWMNLFLLHPWIRQMGPGGKAVGAAVIGTVFAAQYGLLLLLLAYRQRHPVNQVVQT